jgi:transcriptional regulator with XRE-family HTH domain
LSNFSERIKWLRKQKGESQTELGKAVGKSRGAVAKYEIGENEPDMDTLAKLSRHYEIPIDSMITDDEYIVLNNCSKIAKYSKYLQDDSFAEYIELAAMIKEHNLDLQYIKSYVEVLITNIKKNKRIQGKTP